MDVHQSVDQSMSTIKTTINKFEQAQKYMDRTSCKNWAQDIINELNVAKDQLNQCKATWTVGG